MKNKMFKKKKDGFNPLIFLMALGAGGIAVIPFAFLQYTFPHGEGLVKISQLGHGSLPIAQEILFFSLEAIMIFFSAVHLILMFMLSRDLFKWMGSESFKDVLGDPLRNASLVAPFIALVMTFNVFIGPIRFFIPWFASNLQMFMLPALIAWGAIWVVLMKVEFELLRISFEKNFDVDKITFGWLLHPFALAMLTVTGTGIAAMAASPSVAHVAAFMSLVSGGMGFFLFMVKLFAIFKSHFSQDGLPGKMFMPSFLIVVPNVTLFAISAFRLGHYLEKQFGYHLGPYFLIVMLGAYAFETWYLGFGLTLMKRYIREDFFNGEFYVTQWGLVCPFVAYAVLGSFTWNVFTQSSLLYGLILFTTAFSVWLFVYLGIRQMKCWNRSSKIKCL